MVRREDDKATVQKREKSYYREFDLDQPVKAISESPGDHRSSRGHAVHADGQARHTPAAPVVANMNQIASTDVNRAEDQTTSRFR